MVCVDLLAAQDPCEKAFKQAGLCAYYSQRVEHSITVSIRFSTGVRLNHVGRLLSNNAGSVAWPALQNNKRETKIPRYLFTGIQIDKSLGTDWSFTSSKSSYYLQLNVLLRHLI
jgi:hypothetical protein